jgi:acyl carrier protein
MTRTEINDIIVSEIKKVLENDALDINADTVIQDIPEWDSLNNVDLEMTLETECGIDFEVGEFEELKTLANMIDTVEKKVN